MAKVDAGLLTEMLISWFEPTIWETSSGTWIELYETKLTLSEAFWSLCSSWNFHPSNLVPQIKTLVLNILILNFSSYFFLPGSATGVTLSISVNCSSNSFCKRLLIGFSLFPQSWFLGKGLRRCKFSDVLKEFPGFLTWLLVQQHP